MKKTYLCLDMQRASLLKDVLFNTQKDAVEYAEALCKEMNRTFLIYEAKIEIEPEIKATVREVKNARCKNSKA